MRFREYLESQEDQIISQLPYMNMVQQANLDQELHQDAINKGSFGQHSNALSKDINWKQVFTDIIQGKEQRPEVIRQTMDAINRDMQSHKNRIESVKMGSQSWHKAWVQVYEQWLEKLKNILGAIDGTKREGTI